MEFEPFPIKAKDQDTPFSTERAQTFQTLDNNISSHIKRVLALSEGKIHGPGGAAKLLDINPHTLCSKMHKLGIRVKKIA